MSEPRSMSDRQSSALEREWREQKAASAPPPPEPQGRRERSGLATCSLPVSLAEDIARLMEDCAHDSPQNVAQDLRSLAAELRAYAEDANPRQQEQNK